MVSQNGRRATHCPRLPIVRMIDGREWLVDWRGLILPVDVHQDTQPPPEAEIELSRRWLIERIGSAGRIATPYVSSYAAKHATQSWCGIYVGTGSLIVAAAVMGFSTRPQRHTAGPPRNAIIGISLRVFRGLAESPTPRPGS